MEITPIQSRVHSSRSRQISHLLGRYGIIPVRAGKPVRLLVEGGHVELEEEVPGWMKRE